LSSTSLADHKRLDALTELVERTGAKLIAVGDGKQLPSIGPGGMFDRLTQHTPTIELETIHRTKDPDEQRAWQALRAGEPERAMAHYQARGRLHLADTRDQAAENAVQTWAQLTEHHDIRQVALIADASNKEIDRLNARAQHLRAQRGELGPDELPLASVHYGLRQGDHVAFIAQHRPPGQTRVENGTRGEVTDISRDRTVTLALDGSGRTLRLAGEDVESLRLAYAQHVYRQQGATVDRAVVLTGGWQTSKETAYVQATRARHGTDWHLARDQLGAEGQDPDRITRLAQRMSNSRLRTPSTDYSELPGPAWRPTRDPLRLLAHKSWLVRARPKGRRARSSRRTRALTAPGQRPLRGAAESMREKRNALNCIVTLVFRPQRHCSAPLWRQPLRHGSIRDRDFPGPGAGPRDSARVLDWRRSGSNHRD
jgi:hypothetical protein